MVVRIQERLVTLIALALNAAHVAAFFAGAGLVAWACYVTIDSAYTQWAGSRALAAERLGPEVTIVPNSAAPEIRDSAAPSGTVLGKFSIPRLGLSLVILEGTDARTLDKSIGRVENTARLGDSGNIGLAGHRNTHFRKLESI